MVTWPVESAFQLLKQPRSGQRIVKEKENLYPIYWNKNSTADCIWPKEALIAKWLLHLKNNFLLILKHCKTLLLRGSDSYDNGSTQIILLFTSSRFNSSSKSSWKWLCSSLDLDDFGPLFSMSFSLTQSVTWLPCVPSSFIPVSFLWESSQSSSTIVEIWKFVDFT